jgi:hypothetical protein
MQESSLDKQAPPLRKILKAKRRIGTDEEDATEVPVRNLWKDIIKSRMSAQMKEKSNPMASLQAAFEKMDVSPKQKRVKYEGGWYTIHIGERGGKYIMVQGKKKYIRK